MSVQDSTDRLGIKMIIFTERCKFCIVLSESHADLNKGEYVPKNWSKTDAFANFDTELENVRWSWSGISRDESHVVLVLWQDSVKMRDGHLTYWDDEELDAEWRTRTGAKRRIEHIQHAIDKCEGKFHAVIAVARDVNSDPREIERCFPQENVIWMVDDFDHATGAFKAHGMTAEKSER